MTLTNQRQLRSARTAELTQSEIRAMTRACAAVGGVNMGQGICDVPTPAFVKQAAKDAIDADHATYTRFDGIQPLREALAWKLQTHNGVTYNPENEIVATIGASGAYAATLMALCNPGDEVVLFEPYYGYHLNTAKVAGLKPVIVPLSLPDLTLDVDRLRDAITDKTRVIVVNTPANPSGKVFTRSELEAIASLCRDRGIFCVTDEVYEYMVYPGREHLSMASLPDARDLTVTIGSYSKTFSITGWRIGFAAAPAPIAAAIGLVNDLYYVCAPAPLQHAVAVGVRTATDEFYAQMVNKYANKRDQFCNLLREIGLDPLVPKGAYYVLADVSSIGEATAKDAAMRLLHEAGVASIAGSAFFQGVTGERFVRFCYAKSDGDLDRACEGLASWHKRR